MVVGSTSFRLTEILPIKRRKPDWKRIVDSDSETEDIGTKSNDDAIESEETNGTKSIGNTMESESQEYYTQSSDADRDWEPETGHSDENDSSDESSTCDDSDDSDDAFHLDTDEEDREDPEDRIKSFR